MKKHVLYSPYDLDTIEELFREEILRAPDHGLGGQFIGTIWNGWFYFYYGVPFVRNSFTVLLRGSAAEQEDGTCKVTYRFTKSLVSTVILVFAPLLFWFMAICWMAQGAWDALPPLLSVTIVLTAGSLFGIFYTPSSSKTKLTQKLEEIVLPLPQDPHGVLQRMLEEKAEDSH